ncbi:MAG: hypothetical protein ACI30A_06510 [Paludibacteraceae bacterium]
MYLQDADKQKAFICDMFLSAKKIMVLVSPFWNLDTFAYNNFECRMYNALSKGIDIFIICKENDFELLSNGLSASERKNLHILCASDFHLKLYFNDSVYLITSMNISQYRGRGTELGVMIQDRYINGASVRYILIDYICSFLRYEDGKYFRNYFENLY